MLFHSIGFLKQIFKMKFNKLFQKTAFYSAVEKENYDIIKLLLTKDELNANTLNIEITILIFNMILKSQFW